MVDYVELDDGSWKIVEAGDGSVSGLSQNQVSTLLGSVLSTNYRKLPI